MSYPIKMRHMPQVLHHFIDESFVYDANEKHPRMLLVGCATLSRPDELRDRLNEQMGEMLHDPYYARYKTRLQKGFFHATEDHPDVYTKNIRLLSASGLRCYVEAIRLMPDDNAESKKRILMKNLLRDRLQGNTDSHNIFVIEQDLPRPTITALRNAHEHHRDTLREVVKTIQQSRPHFPSTNHDIQVKKKTDEPLLASVDYMLHIIGAVMYKGADAKERDIENFRLLEQKIALIHDLSRAMYFRPRRARVELSAFTSG